MPGVVDTSGPRRRSPGSVMKHIATLTLNPTIDRNTSVARVIPEAKLRCSEPRREPGGGGLNVSRAIERLGGSSVAIYTSGGPTGHMLRMLLDRSGIDHEAVSVSGWTRENIHVDETSTGLQYRFGMPGPTLVEGEWQRCLEAVAALDPAPDYLVASGSLPPGVPDDFYAELARRGGAAGVRVVVDTSGPALRHAVEAGVYAIKPNMTELEVLSEVPLDREERQEEACRRLIERGRVEVVLASFGASGVLMVTADRSERIRAPVVPIKSKVGAGDSMVGGFVLALARGLDVGQAARFGVAAGTAAVMTPGTELCRREDAEALFAEMSGVAVGCGKVL